MGWVENMNTSSPESTHEVPNAEPSKNTLVRTQPISSTENSGEPKTSELQAALSAHWHGFCEFLCHQPPFTIGDKVSHEVIEGINIPGSSRSKDIVGLIDGPCIIPEDTDVLTPNIRQ